MPGGISGLQSRELGFRVVPLGQEGYGSACTCGRELGRVTKERVIVVLGNWVR